MTLYLLVTVLVGRGRHGVGQAASAPDRPVQPVLRWADLMTLGQRAEELGFDAVWLGEHLLARFPDGQPWAGGHATVGPWECWSLLAALAAVTKRVELGPLVACTSFHNPARLAKMVDTVDEIAGGRLILGLGAGWHAPEYDAFGYPFDHRVSRFEEALTIIHTLLRTGQIDFEGRYYQARECELRPRGPRPAGPPILIGTTGQRMLRLTAQYADLWNVAPWDDSQPEALRPLYETVNAACRDAGRDPATLARTIGIGVNAMHQKVDSDGPAHTGTLEMLADVLRNFAQDGVSHIQIWFRLNTLANIEAFAPVLELVDRG